MKGTIKRVVSILLAVALVITSLQYTPKTVYAAADYTQLEYAEIGNNANTEFAASLSGSKIAVYSGPVTLNVKQYQNAGFSELYLACGGVAGGANFMATINGQSVETDGTGIRMYNAADYLTYEYNVLEVFDDNGDSVVVIYCPANAGKGTYEITGEKPTVEETTTEEYVFTDGAEMLKNTTFVDGTEWNVPADATLNGDGSISVVVPAKESGDNWSTQLVDNGIVLTEGKWYVATVTITSDVARSFQLMMQSDGANGGNWSVINSADNNGTFAVEAGVPYTYTAKFQANGVVNNYLYGIMMGYVGAASPAANVTISNVSLKGYDNEPSEPASGDASISSLDELEEAYVYNFVEAGEGFIVGFEDPNEDTIKGLPEGAEYTYKYVLNVNGTDIEVAEPGVAVDLSSLGLVDGTEYDVTMKAVYTEGESTIESPASVKTKFTYKTGASTVDSNGIAQVFFTTSSNPTDNLNVNGLYEGSENNKPKIPTAIVVKDAEGNIEAFDYGTANVRGNSTANAAKKPYNFKFNDKKDLFEMGKAKKWSLLANIFDKTLMRNQIGMDFQRSLEESQGTFADGTSKVFTSECQPVDLYIDGVYVGTYTLIESVETGSSRVDIDIDGIDEDTNEIVDESKAASVTINGTSYQLFDVLLELGNDNRLDDEAYYFKTNTETFAVNEPARENKNYDYAPDATNKPEFVGLTQAYVKDFETALANNDYDLFSQYIDVDSFVDFYITSEYFMTKDIGFSSTRFYIRDGKMYAGPLWDLDLSSGNNGANPSAENFYAQNSFRWFKNLMANETFAAKVKARYAELQPQIKALYATSGKVDQAYETVKNSAESNYTEAYAKGEYNGWGYTYVYGNGGYFDQAIHNLTIQQANASYGVYGTVNVYNNYADYITEYKTWLKNRNEWLVEQWGIELVAGLSKNSQGDVIVTWDAVEGATGYAITYTPAILSEAATVSLFDATPIAAPIEVLAAPGEITTIYIADGTTTSYNFTENNIQLADNSSVKVAYTTDATVDGTATYADVLEDEAIAEIALLNRVTVDGLKATIVTNVTNNGTAAAENVALAMKDTDGNTIETKTIDAIGAGTTATVTWNREETAGNYTYTIETGLLSSGVVYACDDMANLTYGEDANLTSKKDGATYAVVGKVPETDFKFNADGYLIETGAADQAIYVRLNGEVVESNTSGNSAMNYTVKYADLEYDTTNVIQIEYVDKAVDMVTMTTYIQTVYVKVGEKPAEIEPDLTEVIANTPDATGADGWAVKVGANGSSGVNSTETLTYYIAESYYVGGANNKNNFLNGNIYGYFAAGTSVPYGGYADNTVTGEAFAISAEPMRATGVDSVWFSDGTTTEKLVNGSTDLYWASGSDVLTFSASKLALPEGEKAKVYYVTVRLVDGTDYSWPIKVAEVVEEEPADIENPAEDGWVLFSSSVAANGDTFYVSQAAIDAGYVQNRGDQMGCYNAPARAPYNNEMAADANTLSWVSAVDAGNWKSVWVRNSEGITKYTNDGVNASFKADCMHVNQNAFALAEGDTEEIFTVTVRGTADYTFKVKVVSDGTEEPTSEETTSEEDSSTVDETTTTVAGGDEKPAAPAGLVHAPGAEMPHYFAWATTEGAVSYNFYVNGILVGTTAGASFEVTDAAIFEKAGEYTIGVTAVNANGVESDMTTITYKVEGETETETEPDITDWIKLNGTSVNNATIWVSQAVADTMGNAGLRGFYATGSANPWGKIPDTAAMYNLPVFAFVTTGEYATSVVIDGVEYTENGEDIYISGDCVFINQALLSAAPGETKYYTITATGTNVGDNGTFIVKVVGEQAPDISGVTLPGEEGWTEITGGTGSTNGSKWYAPTATDVISNDVRELQENGSKVSYGGGDNNTLTVPVFGFSVSTGTPISVWVDGVKITSENTFINNNVISIAQSVFNLDGAEEKIFYVTLRYENVDHTYPLKIVAGETEDPIEEQDILSNDGKSVVASWDAYADATATSYTVTYVSDGTTVTTEAIAGTSYNFTENNIILDNNTKVTVTAVDGDNAGTVIAVDTALADLTIIDMYASGTAYAGKAINITSTVKNIGTARATSSNNERVVAVTITAVEFSAYNIADDGLLPNDTLNIVVGYTPKEEGTATVTGNVNDSGRIYETDRNLDDTAQPNNNTMSITMPVVEEGAVVLSPIEGTNKVLVTWKPYTGFDGTVVTEYILAYTSNDITKTFINGDRVSEIAGTMTYNTETNTYSSVIEVPLDNNTMVYVHAVNPNDDADRPIVGADMALVDLIITEIGEPLSQPRIGYTFNISITVKNQGTAQVKGSDSEDVEVFYPYTIPAMVKSDGILGEGEEPNGSYIHDEYHSGLLVGDSQVLTFEGIEPTMPGDIEFNFKADSHSWAEGVYDGFHAESNEDNNTMSKTITVLEKEQVREMPWTPLYTSQNTDEKGQPVVNIANNSDWKNVEFKILDTSITNKDFVDILTEFNGYGGRFISIRFEGSNAIVKQDATGTTTTKMYFRQVTSDNANNFDDEVDKTLDDVDPSYEGDGVLNDVVKYANGINLLTLSFAAGKYYIIKFVNEDDGTYLTMALRVPGDLGQWVQAKSSDNGVTDENALPFVYHRSDLETTGGFYYDGTDLGLATITCYNGNWLDLTTDGTMTLNNVVDEQGNTIEDHWKVEIQYASVDEDGNFVREMAQDDYAHVGYDPGIITLYPGEAGLRSEGKNIIHIKLPDLIAQIPIHSANGGATDSEYYYMKVFPDINSEEYISIPVRIIANIPEIAPITGLTGALRGEDLGVAWDNPNAEYKYDVYIQHECTGDYVLLKENATVEDVYSADIDGKAINFDENNNIKVVATWCEQTTEATYLLKTDLGEDLPGEEPPTREDKWVLINGEYNLPVTDHLKVEGGTVNANIYYYTDVDISNVVGYNGAYIAINGNEDYFAGAETKLYVQKDDEEPRVLEATRIYDKLYPGQIQMNAAKMFETYGEYTEWDGTTTLYYTVRVVGEDGTYKDFYFKIVPNEPEQQVNDKGEWVPLKGDSKLPVTFKYNHTYTAVDGTVVTEQKELPIDGYIEYYDHQSLTNTYTATGYNSYFVSLIGMTDIYSGAGTVKLGVANTGTFDNQDMIKEGGNAAEQTYTDAVIYDQLYPGEVQINAAQVFTVTNTTTYFMLKITGTTTADDGTTTETIKYLPIRITVETGDVEVRAFQMNTNTAEGAVSEFNPSFRTVSRTAKIMTKNAEDTKLYAVVNFGTLYTVNSDLTNEEMVFTEEGIPATGVNDVRATEKGVLSKWAQLSEDIEDESEIERYTYYAVTFKSTTYYSHMLTFMYKLRAYAVLDDGTIIYQTKDVPATSIEKIAEVLYTDNRMTTKESHDFLYDHVLNIVAIGRNRKNIGDAMFAALNPSAPTDEKFILMNYAYEDLLYYVYMKDEYETTYAKYSERGEFKSITPYDADGDSIADGIVDDYLINELNTASGTNYGTVAEWIYNQVPENGFYRKQDWKEPASDNVNGDQI